MGIRVDVLHGAQGRLITAKGRYVDWQEIAELVRELGPPYEKFSRYTIYHILGGRSAGSPQTAHGLVKTFRRHGVDLTFDELYEWGDSPPYAPHRKEEETA